MNWDGRTIAYRGMDSIRLIESDGGEGYTLLPEEETLFGATGGPVWSPTGRMLLYSVRDSSGCSLKYLNLDRGETTVLIHNNDNVNLTPVEWR